MTNLAQNLTDASDRHGDRTAIKLDATMGLIFNRSAYRAIATALAKPELP